MTKENTIKVVHEILNHTGLNAKAFSDSIGKDRPQWLYNVLNPDNPSGLSVRMVDVICEVYPELSRSYLLTGEGSLLRADKAENIQQNINSSHITQTGNIEAPTAQMDKLISVLAEQSQQVTKAQEQIDRLITIIEKQSNH
jgi:hypothetical protein